MFMKPSRETRTRTLGEIINERMTEKKTEIQSQFSDGTELIKVDTHLIYGILWEERLKVDYVREFAVRIQGLLVSPSQLQPKHPQVAVCGNASAKRAK